MSVVQADVATNYVACCTIATLNVKTLTKKNVAEQLIIFTFKVSESN